MKKKIKNLVIALTIIAASAIPLMAQEFDTLNIDKQLSNDIIATIKKDVAFDKEAIEEAEFWYYNFHPVIKLMELMDNTSLSHLKKDIVRQEIFTAINDISKEILDISGGFQVLNILLLTDELEDTEFKYFGRNVTLQELFDFSKKSRNVHYNDNTPIVQLLALQQKLIPNEKEDSKTTNKPISRWLQSLVSAGQNSK